MIWLVVIAYGALFMMDGYPILKGYKQGKLLSYSIFFSAAFLISFLLVLKVKIPSPSEGIKKIIIMIIGD